MKEKLVSSIRLTGFQQRAEERQSRQEALRDRREEQQAAEQAAKQLEEERTLQAQVVQRKHEAVERKAKLLHEKKAREMKVALEAEQRIKYSRADEFRNQSLVNYWGIEPWKGLIEIQSQKLVKAQLYHHMALARKVVTCWKEQMQETLRVKETAFREVFNHLIKRILFDHLLKVSLGASKIFFQIPIRHTCILPLDWKIITV